MREYEIGILFFSVLGGENEEYKEQDFTLELKEKVQCMEKETERISFKLFKDYSHLYIEKNMELFIELIRDK